MDIIYENWFIIMLIVLSIIIYFPISLILNKCKNSDSKKIIFIKISLILGSIFFVLGLTIYIYLMIKYDANIANKNLITTIFQILLIFFSIPGLLMLMFGNIKPPKPDKYLLKQDNYIDFSKYLKKRVKLFNYEEKYTNDKLKVYHREIKKKRYYIIDREKD